MFSADAVGSATLTLGDVTIVDPDLKNLSISILGASTINIAA
jgi:hypothetical protein